MCEQAMVVCDLKRLSGNCDEDFARECVLARTRIGGHEDTC